MSGKTARAERTIRLANLLAVLDNGDVVKLDIQKVTVIDKDTSKPLFKEKEQK